MLKSRLGMITICVCLVAGFVWPIPAAALTNTDIQKYVLERLVVNSGTGTNIQNLKAKLEFEVNRMVDKGHMKPGYFDIGIMQSFILWGNPAEEAYILASTLPYLTSATQTRLKTFLNQEVRNFDLTSYAFEHCQGGWGACEMTGNRREYYTIPTSPNLDPVVPNLWPAPTVPVENLYMLWNYADKTGDWAYISTTTPPSGTRWNNIRSMFGRIPATPTRYGEIAAAIGYVRILEHYNLQTDATYQQALNMITAGMNAGLNFRDFVNVADSKFLLNVSGLDQDWAFTVFHYLRQRNAVGTMFAPEVGRYLGENALASVRKVVTLNPDEAVAGEVAAIESHWPEWYMMRGPYPEQAEWTGHYGENHMMTPDNAWSVFMIEAYAYNTPGAKLENYLSYPLAVGDLYYINKLTATLDGYGQKCWQNVRTGAQTCTGQIACPTDINQNLITDKPDLDILKANFFKSPLLDPRADISADGLADLSDYTLLAGKYSQNCTQ